jgi:ATP-binding cassette subfamily F protein uup
MPPPAKTAPKKDRPARPPIVALKDVQLQDGAVKLFDGVDLGVEARSRACLVGRNGAGKSTLMRLIAGEIEPDGGNRFVQPGLRFAFVPQEPVVTGETVHDYVTSGGAEGYEADAALESFGLAPSKGTQGLSGGEIRRAALAKAFAESPDLILLDEPTNHLDIFAIETLEEELSRAKAAALIVSHDRAFLNRITGRCYWLAHRKVRTLDQGFAAFEPWAAQMEAEEQEKLRRLEKAIERETYTFYRSITAQRTRNEGRARALEAMRQQKVAILKDQTRPMELVIDSGGTSGKLVAEVKGISKTFSPFPLEGGRAGDGGERAELASKGARGGTSSADSAAGAPPPLIPPPSTGGGPRLILKDFTTRIVRGDRIAIVGPNGAGKTTLVKLLLGELAPDEGTVKLGTNLQVVYLDQARDDLKSDTTLWDALTPNGGDSILVRGRSVHVAAYARDFLFRDGQLRQPVSTLSGGERNRLLLARALAKPANLFVLDEPTNDLDMETLDLLEDLLADYDGTLILISHDRDFVDRLASSTIALDGRGNAVETPGGWTDFVRQNPGFFEGGEAEPLTSHDALHRGPLLSPEGRGIIAPEPSPLWGEGRVRGTAAPPPKPVKLTFKDQHRLTEAERQMHDLPAEIAKLEAVLADPALFTRNPTKFDQTTKALDAARVVLERAEEDWLMLEEKRAGLL